MQSRSTAVCGRRARAGQGQALRWPQLRPALTAPARGGCEIGGRDGRMARSAAEQKNGLTAISAVVVSAMKKSRVHLIRRAQVIPMLGRKVVEGQQGVAILDQTFDRPTVFGAVFLDEDVDRRFGGRPVRRPGPRADPSSWWPAPRAGPCPGRSRSCAPSIAGAVCRERPRPAPSRSRARRRRQQFRARSSIRAV